MANKAKHAFGKLENLNSAIEQKLVDSYDILFMKDENDKAVIGWIDAQGNPVIVTDEKADLTELESSVSELEKEVDAKANAEEVDAKVSAIEEELASKVSTETLESEISELEAEVATKATTEDVNAVDAKVSELETEVATKASTEEVNAKINTAVSEAVESAVSEVVNDVGASYEKVKYEVTDVPVGTLVNMYEREIRIMCPTNAEFTKQSVGEGGDTNTYYCTFKTYCYNDEVVGYIEHLNGKVDAEILTDLKEDEYGRKYQPTWLGIAKYDEATGVWNYYGTSSSGDAYIGWDYQIDWYNADGVMIASDSIRINLSNEECHNTVMPSYAISVLNDAKVYVDEQIAKAESTIEIVEF